MACRVFRYIKTGVIQDEMSTALRSTTLRFTQQTNLTISRDNRVDPPRDAHHAALDVSRAVEFRGDWRSTPPKLVLNWGV
jgi:hypothetical protein